MIKNFLAMVALCLFVAGCGTMYETEPVGTGYDINELKLSPCSCIQIKQKVGQDNPWATSV